MRATAHNPQVAGLMGIDANRIIALTFVIGAALAAVAGVMVASYYGIAHYAMGSQLGLKAFCAAVLGGIGNIPGAMLGGLLLGLVEALGAGYIGDLTGNVFGSNYQDVFAFIVLIGVLVLRPSGLLGARVGARGGPDSLGADHQSRDPVRVPVAGIEHRRRLRRSARSWLHRLLCG